MKKKAGTMGHKQQAFATTHIDLVEGYWADVRPLTGTEQITVQQALTGGPITSINTSTRYSLHDEAYTRAALSVFIVKWNIDDDSHTILPINEDTVMSELNAYEQMVLMRAYRRMNTPLTDEEVLQGQPKPLP